LAWSHSRSVASPLDGIYHVTEFAVDDKVSPPLATDPIRWNWVGIENGDAVLIQRMTGARWGYRLRLLAPDTLELRTYPFPEHPSRLMGTLRILRTDDEITLSGQFRGIGEIRAHLKRDNDHRLLMNRGFHWISQVPFNH
jgi:hypothetical protein